MKKGTVPFFGGLELSAVAGGTRMRLRVKPGARRSVVVGVHGGALKLAVAAAPEKGRANRAVVLLLADLFGLAPSAVTIAAGDASQDKVAEIALDPATIRARCDALERSKSPC